VRRLAVAGGLALCEVRPFTGRTHQVRVHLSHLGHPVMGDSLYGGRHETARPFLHAWRLVLPHPRERRSLTLEAPIPQDMARFLADHALRVPGA
jgi:23S rRNA pseudouridine1911/1915/1917 synthase